MSYLIRLSEFLDSCLADVSGFLDRVCGAPRAYPPSPEAKNAVRLSPGRRAFAIQLLTGEFSEFVTADSLHDEADALVDLAYVAMGRMAEMGAMFSGDGVDGYVADLAPPAAPLRKPSRLPGSARDAAVKELATYVSRFVTARSVEDEVHALSGLACHCFGRLLEMGVSPEAAFNAVHNANMRKVGGSDPSRSGSHDAVKPDGWEPPDWRGVLSHRVGDWWFTLAASDGVAPKFMKHDSAKDCRPELIPAPFLWELGKLFARGAAKYAAENWRLNGDSQRYVGAAERHLLAWRMGEKSDGETGVSHLVAAAWNLCALFVVEVGGGAAPGPDASTRYAGHRQ